MIQEYRSSLFFNESRNKITIPKDIWFTASPLYDKDSYELNLNKCRQLLAEREVDRRIDLQIRLLIRNHFDEAIRTKQLLFMPNLQQLATHLAMSERTLIRKLQGAKSSFRTILNQERQSYSRELLNNASLTIYDVAEILGYKESANFCRAFKGWFGRTPTQYRKKLK